MALFSASPSSTKCSEDEPIGNFPDRFRNDSIDFLEDLRRQTVDFCEKQRRELVASSQQANKQGGDQQQRWSQQATLIKELRDEVDQLEKRLAGFLDRAGLHEAAIRKAVNKHMGLSDLERESAIEAVWKALREKDIGRRVVLHGGPENVCRSG